MLFTKIFRSTRARLHPTPTLQADISWIRFIIQASPNVLPLHAPEPVDVGWWGDASTSSGVGIVVGRFWAAWKWAPGFTVGPKHLFDIGWAEAVAVELGLRLAEALGMLPGRGRSILGRSDNTGVVSVMNKGRSRNGETNRILKHVFLLQARRQVRVRAVYVPSEENVADALSRGDIKGFRRRFPHATERATLSLPEHLQGKLIEL